MMSEAFLWQLSDESCISPRRDPRARLLCRRLVTRADCDFRSRVLPRIQRTLI